MDNGRINSSETRLGKFREIRRRKRVGLVCSVLFGVLLFVFIVSSLSVTRFSAIAVSPVWNGTAANGFAGGSGTEPDPYLITTGEQLAYLSQQVNAGTTYSGKYIKLTQDILLNEMKPDGTFVSGSPRQFTRIGSDARRFAGHFEGDGYEIIGLYINNEGNVDYQGLFGYADTGSVIRKLKISGSIKGGNRAGAVAGFTNGLITECTIKVRILANWRNYHGGVAGEAGADSVISNCSVKSNVEGSKFVGGIAGYTSGKIMGSDAGSAIAGQDYVGGIVGWAIGTGSEISNCHFSGTATVNGNYIGGIAGRTDGLITGCTVDATVTGLSGYVGGIVGWAYGSGSVISNCTFTGAATVSAQGNYLGGIAGRVDGVITQSSVDAAITGQSGYVGGVAGWAGSDSVISNASAGGSVSGKSGKIGGIAGYTDGTVKISINTATVQSNGSYTGGIAGEAGDNATVSNSFNGGKVENNGGLYYGGIVGYVGTGTEVHHNLNMGEVGGTSDVGSVIGNTPGEGNAWNNYYKDYQGAPGGTNGGDIHVVDGAVPVGDMDWKDIQVLLNTNNDDGDNVWNQDLDDNGVTKPGSGTESTPNVITSAMKGGKFYTKDALGGGTAVDITSDSVFTVSFTLEYAASFEPKNHTISFVGSGIATALPVGTSITMLTEGSYYYIHLTAPIAVITLSDFVKMGSTDLHYNPAPVGTEDTKEYLFIYDFTNVLAEHQLPADVYQVKLDTPGVGYIGGLPAVTITGRNNYDLSVSRDVNLITIHLVKNLVDGYDFKTDGKVLAYELYLGKAEDHVTERIALPIGTKVNGNFVSSALPYAFVPAEPENPSTITLDMSDSVDPIPAGDYTLYVIAYSCTDMTKPRNGYMLAGSMAELSIASPIGYAIKATARIRLLDLTVAPIYVAFNIETQGSGVVKSTLQKKFGNAYVNIDGQINLPVAIAGESAILALPAESPKGTYRFMLTLYDDNGAEQAKDVENVIIK